jgi:hypothetical protein
MRSRLRVVILREGSARSATSVGAAMNRLLQEDDFLDRA